MIFTEKNYSTLCVIIWCLLPKKIQQSKHLRKKNKVYKKIHCNKTYEK